MKPSKEKIIIILGPPGSGKGTQAGLLAEKLGLFHLETSKIIETNLAQAKKGDFVKIKNKKYFLIKEKTERDKGGIMSPPLVSFWLEKKIRQLRKEGEGIIFSGSPRTLNEGREIIPLLKKLYGKNSIKVVLLSVREKYSAWRTTHRRICRLFRHPILFSKETKNLKNCPFDGSKLIIREDDDPKVIKTRWKEYKERTLPLIDYFKKERIKVIEVNGEPPPVVVFQEILKAISR
jgi:adenylate kinase